MNWLRRVFAVAIAGLLLAAAGCSTEPKLGRWDGPVAASLAERHAWSYGDQPAKIITTDHYRLHTTIRDDQTVDYLPQLMEGAFARYEELVPGLKPTAQLMDCYIFRSRTEWDSFTRKTTGDDAAIYLKIISGGYTVRDMYVAYYIGQSSTFSVAAHEGWHQFCGRNFKGRLPPFLEEGLACMFETVSWEKGLPRFNVSVNPQRAEQLRKAMDTKDLWPLEKLVSTHAGDIVGDDMKWINAYYAQSWAFARFLWEGDGGTHRAAMQRWLNETADGTVHDPSHSHSRQGMPWNRRAVKPMMEYYLGMDMESIEKAYRAYLHRVAYDELASQWKSSSQF